MYYRAIGFSACLFTVKYRRIWIQLLIISWPINIKHLCLYKMYWINFRTIMAGVTHWCLPCLALSSLAYWMLLSSGSTLMQYDKLFCLPSESSVYASDQLLNKQTQYELSQGRKWLVREQTFAAVLQRLLASTGSRCRGNMERHYWPNHQNDDRVASACLSRVPDVPAGSVARRRQRLFWNTRLRYHARPETATLAAWGNQRFVYSRKFSVQLTGGGYKHESLLCRPFDIIISIK